MIDNEKRVFGGWVMWITVLFISAGVLLFGANSLGLIGKTIVERKVFENSYQKSAGDEARQNTLEAELAQINAMLRDGTVTAATKSKLRAQKAALEIQLFR